MQTMRCERIAPMATGSRSRRQAVVGIVGMAMVVAATLASTEMTQARSGSDTTSRRNGGNRRRLNKGGTRKSKRQGDVKVPL